MKSNTKKIQSEYLFLDGSGSVRFRAILNQNGGIEAAASHLALHCLVRNQNPADYMVAVISTDKAAVEEIKSRAKAALDAYRYSPHESIDLSPREHEVLTSLKENHSVSNKEIGNKFNISERTVKFHMSTLLRKFNVHDRHSLIQQSMMGFIAKSESLVGELKP